MNIWPLIIYMFVIAVTPGPNTILSFVNASQKGIPKCFIMNFGMIMGVFVINTVSFLFLSFFSAVLPAVTPYIRVFGVLYLFFLGFLMMKKNSNPSLDKNTGGFMFGFLLQIVNVKMIMLCVTAISLYIIPLGMNEIDSYICSQMIPVMCFVCQVIWAFLGSALVGVYKKYGKFINLLFSFALFALAVWNLVPLIKGVLKN